MNTRVIAERPRPDVEHYIDQAASSSCLDPALHTMIEEQ